MENKLEPGPRNKECEIDIEPAETEKRYNIAPPNSGRRRSSAEMKRIIDSGIGNRKASYFSSFVREGTSPSQDQSPSGPGGRKYSLESDDDMPADEIWYLNTVAQHKVKIAEVADRANTLARWNKRKAYFYKFSFVFLTTLNIVLTIMAGIFSYDGYENHGLQYTASTLSFIAAGVAGIIASFNPSKKAANCKRAEGKLRNIVNKLTPSIVPCMELRTKNEYALYCDELSRLYRKYSAKVINIDAKTFGGGEISEISST